MDFRTTIKTTENRGIMHHSDAMMLIGSCFSDNIGAKLVGAMMNVDVNPFGTIYNPMSIADAVDRIIACRPIEGRELFAANGVWNSYHFHSRHSLPDKDMTIEHMNARIESAHRHLAKCQTLVVTLGTAIVYRLKATDEVVANCHKVPQHEFSRKMESSDDITAVLNGMVEQLHDFNPGLRVVFTVSPIRHIADGLATNSLSKATLRVAVAAVCRAHKQCACYFPSYEIMLDDLRDYRFYATDMVHPSEVAVEYIWQAFQATYFADHSAQAIARCERVTKRLRHRPMSANREVVDRFNADTLTVVRNLVKEYPYLEEVREIRNILDK